MTEAAGPPDRDATAPADPGPEPMPQEGPPGEEAPAHPGAEPIPEPDRKGGEPGTGWIPPPPD